MKLRDMRRGRRGEEETIYIREVSLKQPPFFLSFLFWELHSFTPRFEHMPQVVGCKVGVEAWEVPDWCKRIEHCLRLLVPLASCSIRISSWKGPGMAPTGD